MKSDLRDDFSKCRLDIPANIVRQDLLRLNTTIALPGSSLVEQSFTDCVYSERALIMTTTRVTLTAAVCWPINYVSDCSREGQGGPYWTTDCAFQGQFRQTGWDRVPHTKTMNHQQLYRQKYGQQQGKSLTQRQTSHISWQTWNLSTNNTTQFSTERILHTENA